MHSRIFLTITMSICLAASVATAGGRRSLGDACPHLVGVTGTDGDRIVLDNAAVARLARRGRLAAITVPGSDAGSTEDGRSRSDGTNSRTKWRAEHRRLVKALHTAELKLAAARSDLKALEERCFRLHKESQRLRLRPRIEAKQAAVRSLEEQVDAAGAAFSTMIRRARREGARPGWFRDLPQP